MARHSSTYRGARRNGCKLARQVWGPNWYYKGHITPPRYVPWEGRFKRKQGAGSNEVYRLLKRGDYAGAVRRFFDRKGKAAQRGQ